MHRKMYHTPTCKKGGAGFLCPLTTVNHIRDTGGPFFGSFLWASKEMNGLISSPLSPEIPEEPFFAPGPVACILSAKGYGILGQKEMGCARRPTDN